MITEYTDIGNIRHLVEHTLLPENDNYSRERILEELMLALTKKYDKRQNTKGASLNGNCDIRP